MLDFLKFIYLFFFLSFSSAVPDAVCSISEGGRFGVGGNVKEQERHSQRLQPYPCEYRFGYSLPLGRLQQANYQASVTQRERQKRRLTEANNTLWPHFHPVIHLPQSRTAADPLFLSVSHFSASLRKHLDSTKVYRRWVRHQKEWKKRDKSAC